ncbi:MAG: MFS transporter [Chloroflexi bacterium]|nr:MFS transporter [Chloroflexota bacterium]
MSIASTLRESFSPLKIRNFRIYLGGQAISLVGTWLQMTAQSWVVWELSHSATALGVTMMLGTLPVLLLGSVAGVWADRLDRRKLLIATQAGAMILAFILALLAQTGLVQLWHVYLLAALLGIITAIDIPTQQTFLGDLSGMAEVRKAINLNITMLQVSRILGPALAGLIIATMGAAMAFWLNGLSFVAVIISLWLVTSNQVRKPHSGNFLAEFKEGVSYVATQPRLQDLILLAILVTFFAFPVIMSLLPAVVGKVLHGNAATLSWLMMSSGAGALVGTMFLAPLTQASRRIGAVLGGIVGWTGVWLLIFSEVDWLPLSMASLFFVSIGIPAVLTTTMGLLQVLAPAEMRARLTSLFFTLSFGLQPFASLLAGYSADTLTTPVAIRVNGLLLMLSAVLILAVRPALRRWEANATQSAPVGVDAA